MNRRIFLGATGALTACAALPVRAAISGVTVCRGETNTISAVSATPSTVPAASATADPRSQL